MTNPIQLFTPDFAQKISNLLYEELNHEVIIGNCQGIIIASSDQNKIGTPLFIITKMINERLRELSVNDHEAAKISGGLAGIFLLISYKGHNQCYLGILGNPDKIRTSIGIAARKSSLLFGEKSENQLLLQDNVEAGLFEEDSLYRRLIEEAPVGVYILHNEKFSFINPRFAEIFGYCQEEVIGKDYSGFFVPDDRLIIADNIRQRLTGVKKSVRYQIRGIKKDRTIIHIEVHGSLTKLSGKLVISGTLLDISDQKRTEELLRNADKLSVVSQLAAGVAHEIRNPLTALKGFTQLLRDSTEDHKQYFDIMLSELDRVNLIVSEFLYLAKPQVVNFQKKDVHKLLKSVITLLETQAIMNNVRIIMQVQTEALFINCDENQLKQVFINILKNSIEAMPNGGDLIIQIETKESNQIRVRFIDQGSGIPEDQLKKVGKPFFTTKEKGTGLGLMVSYKIIKEHRGNITITSELEKGTVVDILFPSVSEDKIQ